MGLCCEPYCEVICSHFEACPTHFVRHFCFDRVALKHPEAQGVLMIFYSMNKEKNQGTELLSHIDKWSTEATASLVSLHPFMITLFAKDVIWEITECPIRSMEVSPHNFQSFTHSWRKGNKNWKMNILNILTKRLQWEGSETTSVSRVKTLILLDVP